MTEAERAIARDFIVANRATSTNVEILEALKRAGVGACDALCILFSVGIV